MRNKQFLSKLLIITMVTQLGSGTAFAETVDSLEELAGVTVATESSAKEAKAEKETAAEKATSSNAEKSKADKPKATGSNATKATGSNATSITGNAELDEFLSINEYLEYDPEEWDSYEDYLEYLRSLDGKLINDMVQENALISVVDEVFDKEDVQVDAEIIMTGKGDALNLSETIVSSDTIDTLTEECKLYGAYIYKGTERVELGIYGNILKEESLIGSESNFPAKIKNKGIYAGYDLFKVDVTEDYFDDSNNKLGSASVGTAQVELTTSINLDGKHDFMLVGYEDGEVVELDTDTNCITVNETDGTITIKVNDGRLYAVCWKKALPIEINVNSFVEGESHLDFEGMEVSGLWELGEKILNGFEGLKDSEDPLVRLGMNSLVINEYVDMFKDIPYIRDFDSKEEYQEAFDQWEDAIGAEDTVDPTDDFTHTIACAAKAFRGIPRKTSDVFDLALECVIQDGNEMLKTSLIDVVEEPITLKIPVDLSDKNNLTVYRLSALNEKAIPIPMDDPDSDGGEYTEIVSEDGKDYLIINLKNIGQGDDTLYVIGWDDHSTGTKFSIRDIGYNEVIDLGTAKVLSGLQENADRLAEEYPEYRKIIASMEYSDFRDWINDPEPAPVRDDFDSEEKYEQAYGIWEDWNELYTTVLETCFDEIGKHISFDSYELFTSNVWFDAYKKSNDENAAELPVDECSPTVVTKMKVDFTGKENLRLFKTNCALLSVLDDETVDEDGNPDDFAIFNEEDGTLTIGVRHLEPESLYILTWDSKEEEVTEPEQGETKPSEETKPEQGETKPEQGEEPSEETKPEVKPEEKPATSTSSSDDDDNGSDHVYSNGHVSSEDADGNWNLDTEGHWKFYDQSGNLLVNQWTADNYFVGENGIWNIETADWKAPEGWELAEDTFDYTSRQGFTLTLPDWYKDNVEIFDNGTYVIFRDKQAFNADNTQGTLFVIGRVGNDGDLEIPFINQDIGIKYMVDEMQIIKEFDDNSSLIAFALTNQNTAGAESFKQGRMWKNPILKTLKYLY